VLLRRWLLQLTTFAVVDGSGIALQAQAAPALFGGLRHQGGSNPCRVLISFNWGQASLVAVLAALLLLLAGGLTYLAVQARG